MKLLGSAGEATIYLAASAMLAATISCQDGGDRGAHEIERRSFVPPGRFAVSSYVEDIFNADTVILRPPADTPLYRIDCIHRDARRRFVVTVSRGAIRGVYLFLPDGGFIAKIGAIGEGPGEYTEPRCAIVDSAGRFVIYDNRLLRVSIFDSSGEFVGSFPTHLPSSSPDVGLLEARRGEIVLHHQFGYPGVRTTTWVYSDDGRLVAQFGFLSENTRTALDHWILRMPGPNMAYLAGNYFETDYGSYRIRQYDRRGRFVREFGESPPCWKSIAEADFSILPRGGGMVTPSIMRKFQRFVEEQQSKCSLVRSLQPLGQNYLIQTIIYGRRNPMGKRYVFMIYDLQGRLVKSGLGFRNSPMATGHRYLDIGIPHGLFVVEYPEGLEAGIRLVHYHLQGG